MGRRRQALPGPAHSIDVDPEAADAALLNAFRNRVVDRVSAAAVDLFAWTPEARYDIIVASLYQTPVDPLVAMHAHRPADYWGWDSACSAYSASEPAHKGG